MPQEKPSSSKAEGFFHFLGGLRVDVRRAKVSTSASKKIVRFSTQVIGTNYLIKMLCCLQLKNIYCNKYQRMKFFILQFFKKQYFYITIKIN